MTDTTSEGASPLLAMAWMIGAVSAFTTMAVAGRALSAELDTFEIMLYRSAVGVFVVVSALLLSGRVSEMRPEHMRMHAMRNVAHFTGQNLWFYALATIPLAQVFAIEFTTPIWALLLAAPILGEKITGRALMVAAVGFCGVLIVTRPSPDSLSLGMLTAALSAIGFGLSAVLTRKLTQRQTVGQIMLWLTAMQLVFGIVTAGIDGDIHWPSAGAVPLIVVVGLAGLAAHFCLTSALSLAPAGVVMPFDFLRLPLAIVVGMILFHEPFDPWVLAGGALIFAANYANLAGARRKRRRQQRAA